MSLCLCEKRKYFQPETAKNRLFFYWRGLLVLTAFDLVIFVAPEALLLVGPLSSSLASFPVERPFEEGRLLRGFELGHFCLDDFFIAATSAPGSEYPNSKSQQKKSRGEKEHMEGKVAIFIDFSGIK